MIILKTTKPSEDNVDFCNHYSGLTKCRCVMVIITFCALFFSATQLMAKELNNAEQNNPGSEFTRSIANYDIPNVEVVRKDGKKLPLIKEIDDGRPIIMNFIFASCSAICPMLSHVFSKVQTKLGKDIQKVHLISVSIDPENDTPAKLREYAKKFGADSGWDFYTGTIEASIAIQKAFNAYRGDKMNHAAVILMRAAPGEPWLRLEGFLSPNEVIREYRNLDQQ